MKLLVAALLMLQFGPRAPLTPAESLLGRDEIQHIFAEPGWNSGIRGVDGSAKDAEEIWLTCHPADCELAISAIQRVEGAVTSKQIPRPARSIRVVSTVDEGAISRVKAALQGGRDQTGGSRVLRGLW